MRRLRHSAYGVVLVVGFAAAACGTSDLDEGPNLSIDAGAFDAAALKDGGTKDATTSDGGIGADGSTSDGAIVIDASLDAAIDTGIEDGGVADADPCANVLCTTPPPADCQNNQIVIYAPVGQCNAGVCSYPTASTTDCGAHGTCGGDKAPACTCSDGYTGPTCSVPPPTKTVFVTSATFRGRSLGGVAGADAKCQAAATAAKLGGTFKAWISDQATSPSGTFAKSTTAYVLVDKTVVANDWNDLTDGTLLAPIDVTETGAKAPAGARAWTGTDAAGASIATTPRASCRDWSGSGQSASGTSAKTDASWSNTDAERCATQNRLYCFEQ